MTMLERVTDAIMGPTGVGRGDAEFAARRAIEAMREPNQAMLGAVDALTNVGGPDVPPERAWPTMIDAILKDQQP